jgi:hypothetical protein
MKQLFVQLSLTVVDTWDRIVTCEVTVVCKTDCDSFFDHSEFVQLLLPTHHQANSRINTAACRGVPVRTSGCLLGRIYSSSSNPLLVWASIARSVLPSNKSPVHPTRSCCLVSYCRMYPGPGGAVRKRCEGVNGAYRVVLGACVLECLHCTVESQKIG